MDFIILLLKQNILMFLYLLIGYFLFRKKLIGISGSADIGRMLLHIVMPAAIIKAYMTSYTPERLIGLVLSFLAALLALLLAIFISRIFFKKEQAIERFGAAFSNAGFIGIPLVQMTLGEEAVFYISSFVALLNILQWTYGVFILTGDRNTFSFQKLRTNPVILSFLGGLLLFFLPVRLPDLLTGMIGSLAAMNGPLAMIVLGTYLAQVSPGSLFKERLAYRSSFVRLILIPVLTIILLGFFPAEYHTLKLAVLIAASAPIGSNVAIFAQLYGQDYTQAVKEVCLSTLLCMITLPLITGLADYIL
ncbi:MAG TPA: AEC family transporter [Candidatus Mediterraneibacter faecavium]|uniref:AEC family transporter n=1 Tax=Candidatus Mediterraneibacter faecavium TaxID=2838668 RepID=A0A9D2QAW6_9FIRM|nr:AEC family transporter [Candidatus Mediterraneibacter faecavium]